MNVPGRAGGAESAQLDAAAAACLPEEETEGGRAAPAHEAMRVAYP